MTSAEVANKLPKDFIWGFATAMDPTGHRELESASHTPEANDPGKKRKTRKRRKADPVSAVSSARLALIAMTSSMSVPSSAYLYQPKMLDNEFSVLTDFLETLDEGSFFTTSPALTPSLMPTPWCGDQDCHSRAVALALDDHELPVRVQAALAITELVIVHDSVKDAVSPQVGKVVQDRLKLSDETDLEILNHNMETIVDRFKTELLPMASQLTARLRGSGTAERNDPSSIDVESLVTDGDDDKVYGAMGVAKTSGTVVSCIESSPKILSQMQEVIKPIIRFTLENKFIDLFDNMYDLVDALTFRLHAISPNMWPC
ncbi:hypothetical protein P692DRAFT_20880500 [Suillus brevipes Sb2]|nr:hypothetical protein P692DRAFT_20880500 [Suillus brevipes Sb2]